MADGQTAGKISLIVVLLAITLTGNATHFRGGALSWKYLAHLSGNDHQVRSVHCVIRHKLCVKAYMYVSRV